MFVQLLFVAHELTFLVLLFVVLHKFLLVLLVIFLVQLVGFVAVAALF